MTSNEELTVNNVITAQRFKGPLDSSEENAVNRNNITPRTSQILDVPNESWAVHDAPGTKIGTAGTDDLGLAGAFGTNSIYITAGDINAVSTTRYARTVLTLPPWYKDGAALTLRGIAGMLTAVSTTVTLDFEVRAFAGSALPGSDICTTATQSMNSLTFANLDFTITPTGLVAGSRLDVRMAIIFVHNSVASIPAIDRVQLLTTLQ